MPNKIELESFVNNLPILINEYRVKIQNTQEQFERLLMLSMDNTTLLTAKEKIKMDDCLFIDYNNNVYLQKHKIGNLNEDFETVWLSQHARTVRRKFMDSDILLAEYINCSEIFQ